MSDEEQAVWDTWFGEIVGWTFHPGYTREGTHTPTVAECAAKCDRMMDKRREVRDVHR